MPQVTIEYMIMIPVLILQIFLFPLTATLIMDHWNDSQRTLELQETAGHLGSMIQQLYYTANRVNASGVMQINLDIPATIENYAYKVTLSHVTQVSSSAHVMNVTLQFISTKGSSSTLVTLGNNIDWQQNLTFNSTSHNLGLTATEDVHGSITLTYGGSS